MSSEPPAGAASPPGFALGWPAIAALAAIVAGLDYITGRYISFPIAYTLPVGAGAWRFGRRAGLGLAVGITLLRIAFRLTWRGPDAYPWWASTINLATELVLLAATAVLIDRLAAQRRALARRIETLEGILPICAFCKKIRHPDGAWEPVESYVSRRSSAQFSHGFCPDCARREYGQVFTPPEGGAG